MLTIATLTLALGLLLSVSAQNPGPQPQPKNPTAPVQKYEQVKPGPYKIKVPVGCKQAGSGDVKAKILAFNNTGQTIKHGTVISFETNQGVTGSLTLNTDLAAGLEKYLGKEDFPQFTCKAWFFKD